MFTVGRLVRIKEVALSNIKYTLLLLGRSSPLR